MAAQQCIRSTNAVQHLPEAHRLKLHGLASEIDEAICLQMGPPAMGLKGPLVYYCAEQELAPLQAAVAAFKPDVLVADLFGLAGFWIAEAQHDLPLVINMPANYAIYNMITTVIPKLYAVLRCLPCLRPRHMSCATVPSFLPPLPMLHSTRSPTSKRSAWRFFSRLAGVARQASGGDYPTLPAVEEAASSGRVCPKADRAA